MSAMLPQIAQWLADTQVSATIRDVSVIIPLVQTIHIVAIGIVLSAGTVTALASLGVLKIDWTVEQWTRRLNPWLWGALAVLAASGAILIVGEPDRSLLNLMFQVKMGLLVLAVALTYAIERRVRNVASPSSSAVMAADAGTRLLAVAALLTWLAIISAGRWIAYYTDF